MFGILKLLLAELKCVKEKDELEWDDDCRVGTGEQLQLDVGVEDNEVCASAEKVEEGEEKEEGEKEEEKKEKEEVQELRVAWPLDE